MKRECSTTCIITIIIIYFISVGGHLALIKWEGALVRRCLAASQVWLGTERLVFVARLLTVENKRNHYPYSSPEVISKNNSPQNKKYHKNQFLYHNCK